MLDYSSNFKLIKYYIAGMRGAELFPAGRGGARMKIRGAVRGEAGRKSA